MSEIDEIESRLQFAISAMNAAAEVHKQAELSLREATLSVYRLREALDEARRADDRKLPQCKIVRYGRWRNCTIDGCIVGATKSGMLKVRVIGGDENELFRWNDRTARFALRSKLFSHGKDYLRDVPAEYAR